MKVELLRAGLAVFGGQLPAPFGCTAVSLGRPQPGSRRKSPLPCTAIAASSLGPRQAQTPKYISCLRRVTRLPRGSTRLAPPPEGAGSGTRRVAEEGGGSLAGFVAGAPGQSLEILVRRGSHPVYCSPFTRVTKLYGIKVACPKSSLQTQGGFPGKCWPIPFGEHFGISSHPVTLHLQLLQPPA